MAKQIIDLTGQRFGMLLVLGYPAIGLKSRQANWLCICDCGTQKRIVGGNMRRGKSASCGCQVAARASESTRTHGMAGTPMYNRWRAMHDRCKNPKNKNYQNYGGRGISVCERWASFACFLEDMGECPDGCSLERIDNNGNYESSNCRWATVTEQTRNTRQNRMLCIGGREQVIADWVKESGTPFTTIHNRLKRGVSPEQAVFGNAATRYAL